MFIHAIFVCYYLKINYLNVSNIQEETTLTDVLSCYTFLFKIEDKSAMTVAKKLTLLFKKERYPLFIVSDNGKEFDNQLLKFIEEQFHVTHIYSRYYNPVGLIERKV
jgi:IS30 family transposase